MITTNVALMNVYGFIQAYRYHLYRLDVFTSHIVTQVCNPSEQIKSCIDPIHDMFAGFGHLSSANRRKPVLAGTFLPLDSEVE